MVKQKVASSAKKNLHPKQINKKSFELIGHPHRTLILGKSGSGKTTLAREILKSGYLDSFECVYLLASTYKDQPAYDWLEEKIPKENRFKRLTTLSLAKIIRKHKKLGKPKTLIIIDDQSGEEALHKNCKGLFASLIFNARWKNISMLVMVHRVTAISPAFRDNLEHLILLNVGSRNQVGLTEKEFNILRYRFQFLRMYDKEIAKQNMGFIHFDLRAPASIYPQGRIAGKSKKKQKTELWDSEYGHEDVL